MKVFRTHLINLFIQDAIKLIKEKKPEFSQKKSDEDINKFVQGIIDLSQTHQIAKKTNIVKLMLFSIRHNWGRGLPDHIRSIVKETDFSEDYRIEKLKQQLTSDERRIKIVLGDGI